MKAFASLRVLSFAAVAAVFSCLGFFVATAAEAGEPAQGMDRVLFVQGHPRV